MRSQTVGAAVPSDPRPGSHLRARDLYKGFGDGAVLDGVSLTVTGGQRLAVIGDNGAGNIGLLLVCPRRLVPDGGDVRWTTERRFLIEQEMDAPAGTTVASVRAEALRSPRDALAALSVAASALAAGAEGAGERYDSRARPRRAARRVGRRAATARQRSTPSMRTSTPDRRLPASRWPALPPAARPSPWLTRPGSLLLDEPYNDLYYSSLDRLVRWLVEFPGSSCS